MVEVSFTAAPNRAESKQIWVEVVGGALPFYLRVKQLTLALKGWHTALDKLPRYSCLHYQHSRHLRSLLGRSLLRGTTTYSAGPDQTGPHARSREP